MRGVLVLLGAIACGGEQQSANTRQEDSAPALTSAVAGVSAPSRACNFLASEGQPTRGYRHEWEEKYFCTSDMVEIGSGFPLANNLSYQPTGLRDSITEFTLHLNINQRNQAQGALDRLARLADVLGDSLQLDSVPAVALSSVRRGTPGEWELGSYRIVVERDDWENGRGYTVDVRFRRNPE